MNRRYPLGIAAVGVLMSVSACADGAQTSAAPTPLADVPTVSSDPVVLSAPSGTYAYVILGGGRSRLSGEQASLTIRLMSKCAFEISDVTRNEEGLRVQTQTTDAPCAPERIQQRDVAVVASNLVREVGRRGSLLLQTPDGQLLSVPTRVALS